MDSIENAIRNAFAKGDPGDRAFREKVYRSAFGALDRSLKANPNVTEAIAQRRREALLAAITAIETEFVPARPGPAPASPAQRPGVEPPVRQPAAPEAGRAPEVAAPAAERRREGGGAAFSPTLDGERRPPSGRAAKAANEPVEAPVAPPLREGRRGRPRRRLRLVGPLIFLILLAGLAAGIWWMATSGALQRMLTPTPPQAGENAAPPVPGTGDAFEDWIDVFTPADPTTISAPGDSRAEVVEEEGERFVRITTGASGSPILFDIGQGILEDVAGKRAVFNIVARAREGAETQISVDCNLGELGDCGRKRYVVGAARDEYLFEIDLPARRPGSGGTIAINPDVEGGGKAIDIYAIRVLPAG